MNGFKKAGHMVRSVAEDVAEFAQEEAVFLLLVTFLTPGRFGRVAFYAAMGNYVASVGWRQRRRREEQL